MRRIWKWTIPLDGATIDMPAAATIVHVGPHPNGPGHVEVWAEVDDTVPTGRRSFTIYGTGHPIPDGHRYVGTVQYPAAGLVWHLHEVDR